MFVLSFTLEEFRKLIGMDHIALGPQNIDKGRYLELWELPMVT